MSTKATDHSRALIASLRADNARLSRLYAENMGLLYEQLEVLKARAATIAELRAALESLAAQDSGNPVSTLRSDCMARLASAALERVR